MKYLIFLLLLITGAEIEAQVDFNPQSSRSQVMSWGYAVDYRGETIDGITTLSASEHHISVVFINTDNHETGAIFHGGVRFVGTDRSTGSELYLHESTGLVIGFIINWESRTLQIEYEGETEHFFYVDDVCEECAGYVPPPVVEIPKSHKPSKGNLSTGKIQKL